MKQLSLLFAMVLMAGCFATAQELPAPPPDRMFAVAFGPQQGNFVFMEHGDMRAVKGAPYTATATTESTQVLADGNRIVHSQSGLVARDGEGRTRREESMGALGPLAVHGGKTAFIHDPVTKSMTVLNLDEKTAHVMKPEGPNSVRIQALHEKMADVAGGPGNVHVRIERKSEEEDSNVQRESLGTQTIEGVSAEGTRITKTIAAGTVGNEKPIVITIERWMSPELHTMVLQKRSDPRFGETTFKLTNIKVGEPDPALFQVPSGFTTEQGPGKMKMQMHVPPPPGE